MAEVLHGGVAENIQKWREKNGVYFTQTFGLLQLYVQNEVFCTALMQDSAFGGYPKASFLSEAAYKG